MVGVGFPADDRKPATGDRLRNLQLSYHQIMRFSCQRGCVKCCQQPGFVYLGEEDIVRLAAFLGMSTVEFERRHVYRTKVTARLRMRKGCPFLKADGCSVHPAKPTQCRTFPFWPELIETPADWAEAGTWCPGINNGDIISVEALEASARDMRAAYPYMYESPAASR